MEENVQEIVLLKQLKKKIFLCMTEFQLCLYKDFLLS